MSHPKLPRGGRVDQNLVSVALQRNGEGSPETKIRNLQDALFFIDQEILRL